MDINVASSGYNNDHTLSPSVPTHAGHNNFSVNALDVVYIFAIYNFVLVNGGDGKLSQVLSWATIVLPHLFYRKNQIFWFGRDKSIADLTIKGFKYSWAIVPMILLNYALLPLVRHCTGEGVEIFTIRNMILSDLVQIFPLGHMLYLFFQICIVVPITEEYIFRGILQSYLNKYCSNNVSILLTSLIFALYHVVPSLAYYSNITKVIYIFIFSVYVGNLKTSTGSLIPSTVVHFNLNILAVSTAYL